MRKTVHGCCLSDNPASDSSACVQGRVIMTEKGDDA